MHPRLWIAPAGQVAAELEARLANAMSTSMQNFTGNLIPTAS